MTIADPDFGAAESTTITVTAGGVASDADGTFAATAGLTKTGIGTYTVMADTPSNVQAALQALVFTPTAHQVTPGSKVTTGFSLAVSDGITPAATTNTTTSVVATATETAPVIGGTVANQPITDAQTASPFSGVTITDPDFGSTESTTITVLAGGVVSDADGTFAATTGLTKTGIGTYTVKTDTPSNVQAALQALVFTPTAHQVTPGSKVTTGFSLAVNDGIAPAATMNSTTSVVATATETAPAIGGTTTSSITDAQTASPFSGVTITDPDFGITGMTATVSFNPANGAFTAASLAAAGFTGQNGSYAFTTGANAATLASDLQKLVFTPSAQQVSPGQHVTTAFTLSLNDQHGGLPTNSSTSVVATAAAIPPAIGDMVTSPISNQLTATPSASIAPDTVVINPDSGYFGHGTFVLTGSASSVVGVKSVEITAKVDGVATDLGAAKLNANGTFSYVDHVGANVQGFITATETDKAGGTARYSPLTSFRAGIQGQDYVARQDDYNADGSIVTSTGFEESDGSRNVSVDAYGQTLSSQYDDTFANNGQGATTFVLNPGYGQDTISEFRLAGQAHDMISLPSSDFTSFVQVLHDTQNTSSGAIIHDPKTGDTLTIAGISKAQIAQSKSDFTFHA